MRTYLRGKALLFMMFGLLLAIPAVALADAFDADADSMAAGTGSSSNNLTATQQPGTTQTYDFSAAVRETGNATDDVFAVPGDKVTVANSFGGDWADAAGSSPTSFEITAYNQNHAGVISIKVPCGVAASTQKVMTVTLNAAASNGKSLNGDPTTLNYTIIAGATPAASCTPADTTKPTLHLPADITEEATGASGAVVTYTATADDANPAHPNVTCSPASGSTFAIATTTVNCEATDAAGNKATGSFTVKVQDTTAPTLDAHAGVTEEATGPGGATVNYTKPAATDLVDPNPVVTCIPASGTTFALGTTQVSCKAKDAAGNESAAKTFDVKVQDTTAPTLTVPNSPVVVEATGANGATVNFASDLSASDAVDPSPSITCTPASGTVFELGTTQVSCKAKDAAGNESAAKTFDVKVQDTTAPALTVPSNTVVVEATSAAGATANFASQVSATDAVDANPQVTCTPASGTTFALGTTQVSCKAKDAAGNESAAKTFDVKVQDTTAPTLGSPTDVSEIATSSSGAVVNYTKPSATDAVDPNPTVTCLPAPGTTFPVGSTTVSCTAKDAAATPPPRRPSR